MTTLNNIALDRTDDQIRLLWDMACYEHNGDWRYRWQKEFNTPILEVRLYGVMATLKKLARPQFLPTVTDDSEAAAIVEDAFQIATFSRHTEDEPYRHLTGMIHKDEYRQYYTPVVCYLDRLAPITEGATHPFAVVWPLNTPPEEQYPLEAVFFHIRHQMPHAANWQRFTP